MLLSLIRDAIFTEFALYIRIQLTMFSSSVTQTRNHLYIRSLNNEMNNETQPQAAILRKPAKHIKLPMTASLHFLLHVQEISASQWRLIEC